MRPRNFPSNIGGYRCSVFGCAWPDGTEVAAVGNVTDSVERSDVGFVLLSIMGALDFVMIATALLTAFNTRSVTNHVYHVGLRQ